MLAANVWLHVYVHVMCKCKYKYKYKYKHKYLKFVLKYNSICTQVQVYKYQEAQQVYQ